MSSVLNFVEWVVVATRTSLCGGLLCWSLRGGILAITILVFWRRKEHCLDKSGAEEEWICLVCQTVNTSKWKRENSDSSQHTFKPTMFRLPLSWLSAVSDLSLTLYPKPNLTQPQRLCNRLQKTDIFNKTNINIKVPYYPTFRSLSLSQRAERKSGCRCCH